MERGEERATELCLFFTTTHRSFRFPRCSAFLRISVLYFPLSCFIIILLNIWRYFAHIQ